MPLPWKKSKSSRISRFVSDFQQSPKHGGSLVVETGFPTSLIDLFVKNRDRIKKSSSKRKLQSQITAPIPNTSRRRSSPPPPSIHRRLSLSKLDLPPLIHNQPASKSAESIVGGGLKSDNRQEEEDIGGGFGHGGDGGGGGGGGCCVLILVAFKVFVVAVLALSTKKLAVGITISAFALLFLEIVAARVFTLLKLCPNAQNHLDSLIKKLLMKPISSNIEQNVISNEITESLDDSSRIYKEEIRVLESMSESKSKLEDSRVYKEGIQDFESKSEKKSKFEDSRDCREAMNRVVESVSSKMEDSRDYREGNRVLESVLKKKSKSEDLTKREVQTIRDVVFKNEKSKSSKLKSKIVKKIVPKKLRSYKKKKKMKMKEEEEDLVEENEEEEEGSMTEVSSLVSEEKSERIDSEISEKDVEECSKQLLPPLLQSSCEEKGSKGSEMNAIILLLIALIGLLIGKVLAIGLTLSWCLYLRFATNPRSEEELETSV